MLPSVPVGVDVSSDGVRFRFGSAVSVMMLIVSRGEEKVWELLADDLKPLPVRSVSFLYAMRVEDASPALLETARLAEEKGQRELEQRDPLKKPRQSMLYGEVPEGYQARTPAGDLTPGEYQVMLFSQQGMGGTIFTVPAA